MVPSKSVKKMCLGEVAMAGSCAGVVEPIVAVMMRWRGILDSGVVNRLICEELIIRGSCSREMGK